jgi:hypothetical protein
MRPDQYALIHVDLFGPYVHGYYCADGELHPKRDDFTQDFIVLFNTVQAVEEFNKRLEIVPKEHQCAKCYEF